MKQSLSSQNSTTDRPVCPATDLTCTKSSRLPQLNCEDEVAVPETGHRLRTLVSKSLFSHPESYTTMSTKAFFDMATNEVSLPNAPFVPSAEEADQRYYGLPSHDIWVMPTGMEAYL